MTDAPEETYSVTYDGNGSDGGSVPEDDNQYKENDTVTVLGNTGNLSKTGYSFAGWNTASDGSGTSYAPGAEFPMGTEDVTLYAKWTANTYTVTFDAHGRPGNPEEAVRCDVRQR